MPQTSEHANKPGAGGLVKSWDASWANGRYRFETPRLRFVGMGKRRARLAPARSGVVWDAVEASRTPVQYGSEYNFGSVALLRPSLRSPRWLPAWPGWGRGGDRGGWRACLSYAVRRVNRPEGTVCVEAVVSPAGRGCDAMRCPRDGCASCPIVGASGSAGGWLSSSGPRPEAKPGEERCRVLRC